MSVPPPAISLRPVETADYGPLRRYELDLTLGPRWRHRGATPSPEAFAQSLWQGVLAQFLVVAPTLRPEPLGLVCAYGADLQSGHAHVAAARFDDDQPAAAVPLGVRLFVRYLFGTWPLRKLYAEVLEPNLAPFAGLAERLFVEEGRGREHALVEGAYVDQVLLALRREEWERFESWLPAGEQTGLVSFERFHAEAAEAFARARHEVDPDLPLVDQGLDSLDWVLLAERLEARGAHPDGVVDALAHHVTLRSLHLWLVTEGTAIAP